MNKGKNGITLLSAVVIIAVLLILMGTVVISTDYMLEETDKKEFIREYNLVKAATKDYIIRNSGLIDFEEISVDISNINSENLNQFDGEIIVDNYIEMYVIDLQKIGVVSTTYGKEENDDDVYLISKTTGKIYYKNGFEYKDNIYYTGDVD